MKSALVTGVSRRAGIGFAIARRLEDDGLRVFKQGRSAHDAAQPWGAAARWVTSQVIDSEGGFRRQAQPR